MMSFVSHISHSLAPTSSSRKVRVRGGATSSVHTSVLGGAEEGETGTQKETQGDRERGGTERHAAEA